jgi:hypothetical protein
MYGTAGCIFLSNLKEKCFHLYAQAVAPLKRSGSYVYHLL